MRSQQNVSRNGNSWDKSDITIVFTSSIVIQLPLIALENAG